MKKFTSANQLTGQIGENIACEFLVRHAFKIMERNFTRKWGEIDIIARDTSNLKTLHFIEVKSVSCEISNFDRESSRKYRPEDQLHVRKIERLRRTIQTYLAIYGEEEWQFDVACVYLDHALRIARVKYIKDIIL